MISDIVFEKLRFQSVFFFNSLPFEERFRKPPFSCRISANGRPNRRNKAAFLNSFGVVWMERLCSDGL